MNRSDRIHSNGKTQPTIKSVITIDVTEIKAFNKYYRCANGQHEYRLPTVQSERTVRRGTVEFNE